MRGRQQQQCAMSETDVCEAKIVPVLKLLTLNTHKGFAIFNRRFVLHELRDAVREISADVVFLQEVIGSHARHALRHSKWPSEPHYQFLAESIWADVVYGRNAIYTEGHHGNAVLSKYRIVSHENRDISIGTVDEKRGLLHCVVKVPGFHDEVHAICVHFGLREMHRRGQVERLCAFIQDAVPAAMPLIVAGDFNDWRMRAGPVLHANTGLRDAFIEATGCAAKSFPAHWPFLRLDRVYFRNVRVIQALVHHLRPWSHLSDHAALSVEIAL